MIIESINSIVCVYLTCALLVSLTLRHSLKYVGIKNILFTTDKNIAQKCAQRQ